ncbi:MAG: PAS domain S-box protein, partial [Bacteroidota bacterium]|nr:PAS domain S-box protein [Bacteroidota bacterium]
MARKVVLWYLLAGLLWITFSDAGLLWIKEVFSLKEGTANTIQVYKGYLFVLLTGALLYKLIQAFLRREKEVKDQYIRLFEDNPNPVFIYSTHDYRLVSVNKKAQLKYNLSIRRLDDILFTDLIPEDRREEFIRQVSELSGNKVSQINLPLQGRSGISIENRIHTYIANFNSEPVFISLAVDITQELKREKAINDLLEEVRLKTHYLESILNLSRNLFLIRLDMDGNLLFQNQAFHSIQDDAQVITEHLPFSNTLHQVDQDHFQGILMSIRNQPSQRQAVKLRHLLKNGDIHVVEWEFIAIRNVDGSIKEIQGTGHDVTEGEKNLVELESYKDRIQNITSTIQDVIWSVDLDTDQYIFISSAAKEVYGYSPSQFYLNHDLWFELMHPDDRPKFDEAMKELLEKGKTEFEYRLNHPDGSVRHILEKGVVLYDQNHKPKIINGVASDRTPIVDSRKKLRNYEERLADLLESITDAFFAVDKKWKITYVNKRFEGMFDVKREEVLGEAFWKVFPDARDLEHYPEIYAQSGLMKDELRFEEHLKERDLWIGVSVYPTSEGMAAYIQDLTENKKAEERILEQNRRLKEIAWIQSHGVRKHVANLLALMDILDREVLDNPENPMVIEKMEETIGQLDKLVREIVSSSKV